MRDILVHVRNYHAFGHCAAYAADLAARLNGTLTGVYIEPSPLAITPPYAPVSGDMVVAACQTVRNDETRAGKAAERFTDWAKSIGAPQSCWQIAEGDISHSLVRLANWHDLVVLERSNEDPPSSVRQLGATILASRAPCLVVPPRKHEASLDHIALAWNHSAEAIRAVHAARPLLSHATKITLLEGGTRDPEQDRGWSPAFDIDQYLARHGLKVNRETISGANSEAGELLLATARRCKADLLVMGAYGRSRFSEWIMGGATRSVLFDASLAVFLKH